MKTLISQTAAKCAPLIVLCHGCLFAILISVTSGFAQSDQSNPRFTEGDIKDDASLTLSVPLGKYTGRGLDLPVSLSYSSDLWKMEHIGKVNNSVWPALTQSVNEAYYSKHATSGWKSSLSLPIIEFPKESTKYDCQGRASSSLAGGPGYRIREVYIHMPDGSTHTLRKDDQPVYISAVDKTGTFYAIDESRIRFDANGTSDTGTIYMPDGTRYILGHPTSYVRDRHGNELRYDEPDGTYPDGHWTDTLGRIISNPLPSTPAVGDKEYFLPGLAGVGTGQLKYVFKWKLLENALTPDGSGNPPPLRVVGSEALANPYAAPSASNFPWPQSTSLPRLFASTPPGYGEEGNPKVSGLVVGKGYYPGQLFNPVVLTEIVLPDETSYRFTYNVYGEIDKVVYPTNAYEKYDHIGYPASTSAHICEEEDCEEDPQPYIQSLRWVNKRRQSIDGTGNDIREWTYINAPTLEGPTYTKIIAPDKTRTEIYRIGPGAKVSATYRRYQQLYLIWIFPFGLKDARAGSVGTRAVYSSSVDGLGGTLLRKEVYQYEQTTQSHTIVGCMVDGSPQNRTYSLNRTPRLSRQTSIILEGAGDALAQSTTHQYDLTHQWDTGIDQTSTATYHYEVVSNSVAQGGDLSQIPLGTLAKRTDTDYHNSETYRNANILGVPTVVEIVDSSGIDVVSRSEMVYDECPLYCPTTGRALPTTMMTWDSTKGTDPAHPANQLITHAKFDQWGNRVEATDAKGFVTTTVYDSTYQAFPVQVISPVPDPNNTGHGSPTAFTTTTTYDTPLPNKPPLGLVVATTDANGQTTTTSYLDPVTGISDPLLRPRKVTAPNGHQTITEYGAGTSEETRWVKVRTQIDSEKSSEAISKYDGVGRTTLTKKIDSQGNIGTKSEYDLMGRLLRSTNPYRLDAWDNPAQGETLQWTTPEYDDLSRTKKVTSPDTSTVQFAFGISTTGVIGITRTATDQAGKKRRGITDALGRMVRVIEDPEGQNPLTTDYVFDTLGNLRRTIQGEQSRYFLYNSTGRLLKARQVEQAANAAISGQSFVDPITGNNQWTISYDYDNNGNVVSMTDARNITVTATYDQANRLVFRNYSDPTPDVTFYYDGTGLASAPAYSKGKVTRVANGVSESRQTSFDSMGRLLTSQQLTDGQVYGFSYAYNLSGGLVERTYPSGRVIRNTVNADGELSQVQSKKNSSYGFFTYADSFTYNSAGAVTKMQLGSGRWETAQFNDRLQVTQLGLGATDASQDLLKLEFGYGTSQENNGSMREQKITVPTAGPNPGFTAVQTYTYDSLNRIQSATETIAGSQTWKQAFSIDRYGNRRFDAANTTTLGSCQQTVCNPTINVTDNRLASGQGYVFNATGSITQDAAGQRFGYDGSDKQTQFFASTNSGSTPDATYHYDGDGKRVKKVVGSEVTIFVYDASGALAAEYSTTVAPVEQAKVSYLTMDHLGSPRIVTDQNGAITSRKDFAAYGDEVITSQRTTALGYASYTSIVRQDYTGYQRDDESGLEFAQNRYYNTGHGRFTSVDPLTPSATIKNPQTFNRYSYVTNSPYKFTDPLGLMQADATSSWESMSRGFWGSNLDEGRFSSGQRAISAAMALYEQWTARYFQDARDKNRANSLLRQGKIKEAQEIVDANKNLSMVEARYETSVREVDEEGTEGTAGGTLPTFDELQSAYPTFGLPSNVSNQCAMRVSWALIMGGVDMSSFAGATETVNVNGRDYKLAIRAYELWSWLDNTYGPASSNSGNGWYSTSHVVPKQGETNIADRFSGERGIMVLKGFWGAGQGHIDLWNGTRLASNTPGITRGPNNYFDRSKEIILLNLDSMMQRR